jgi:PAS domain S-box-containing protein
MFFCSMNLAEPVYKTLFDYATIGIVLVTKEAKIYAINPFALQQFGYDNKNELLGKEIEILIPQRFRAKHGKHHATYMQNPENRPMGIGRDLQGVKKNGEEFALEISLSKYVLNNETFIVAFVNDTTKRKQAEIALENLNASLEKTVELRTIDLNETVQKLNQQIAENLQKDLELRTLLAKERELGELKSRFVSMASHEFRTPLSAVLSSTYLLSKYTTTEDNAKREKHIQRIISSVSVLNDILNDLLSVSKIEEGKIKVNVSTFNIKAFIQDVLKDLLLVKKESQVINYTHTGFETITTDANLLKHSCINLLTNAFKFSADNGNISVVSSILNNQLIITIADNGIGISDEDKKHLFERFFRASNAANIQGTGLGLHIVQKYIELLNGTIECASQLDNGTSFTISIPTQFN